tara:strand:- start:517 stop:1236 length:720 start_codon:yes stop_codon:yes gene_type:complete
MVAKQITNLEFYQDALDKLYNEFISPIRNKETYLYEGKTRSIFTEIQDSFTPEFWDKNTTETPKNRCNYDTYKKLKDSPLEFNKSKRNTKSAGCYRNDNQGEFLDKIKYKYRFNSGNRTDIRRFPHDILIEKLKIIYPNDNFTQSNSVKCYKKYKEYNGYMGWHTNHNQPGDRWYFVYNLNENSSFMRFIDPKTEEMITMWEPKGWSLNHFVIGDEKAPLWHCIHTDSERWSIGIKKYN